MAGDRVEECSGCGGPLRAGDLFCPSCASVVVPAGAVELELHRRVHGPVDRPRSEASPTRSWRSRAIGLVAAFGVSLGAWVLVASAGGGGDEAARLPSPMPTVELSPTVAGAPHFAIVPTADTSVLPPSGATHLAISDDRGVQWIELDSGRVTSSGEPWQVRARVEPIPGGVAMVDEDADLVRAASPLGPLWSASASGESLVGTVGSDHWQANWAGYVVLTRHEGSSSDVAERIVLPRWGVLVGFHAGRPVTQVRGVIAVEHGEHRSEVVARGFPVAQAAEWLVYRPCTSLPCRADAVRRNLRTGEETTTKLALTATAFGGWGNELSPDGRHLVTISYGPSEVPALAVTDLDTGTIRQFPRRLLAPAPGASPPFEWSPNARLLAMVGSRQVAVVDIETGEASVFTLEVRGEVTSLAWVSVG